MSIQYCKGVSTKTVLQHPESQGRVPQPQIRGGHLVNGGAEHVPRRLSVGWDAVETLLEMCVENTFVRFFYQAYPHYMFGVSPAPFPSV